MAIVYTPLDHSVMHISYSICSIRVYIFTQKLCGSGNFTHQLLNTYAFNRQQDTMHDNPAYGTIPPISHDPEDGMSPPTLTLNTSVTPPIYATIDENTSKKCSDGVGMEYQVVDDPGVYI